MSETGPKPPPTDEDLLKFQNAMIQAQNKPIKIYNSITYITTKDPRTKRDFLDSYFEKAQHAKTFGELTFELQQAVIALRTVGIFKNIKVNITEMPPHLEQRFKDYCMVSVTLDERKWYNASFGGYMTEDGPEVKLEGSVRNVGGRGETAYGRVSAMMDTISTDALKSVAFSLGMSKPLLIPQLRRSAVLHVLTHNSIYDSMQMSNYSQRVLGGNIRVDMFPHSLAYDLAWRNTTLGPEPSVELQRDIGHSLKSSVKYAYTRDMRDNVVFPTQGHAYQLSTEFAGLGGDVNYLRNEASYNINFPIFKTGFAFNYILKGGMVAPLRKDHTRVSDRFFLGGIGTTLGLRGFKPRGIDTGTNRESHGGDLYYTTAAHLTFPIPFFSHIPWIRGHVFANAGNLVLVKNGQYKAAVEELKDRARSAVGAGIIFTTPFGGRFEFNFCRPLRDKVARGLQFGVAFTI